MSNFYELSCFLLPWIILKTKFWKSQTLKIKLILLAKMSLFGNSSFGQIRYTRAKGRSNKGEAPYFIERKVGVRRGCPEPKSTGEKGEFRVGMVSVWVPGVWIPCSRCQAHVFLWGPVIESSCDWFLVVMHKSSPFWPPDSILVKVKVAQLCWTLCNPMDYTVHGILRPEYWSG